MYDDPGPWNGGRDCAGGWTPGARSLVTYLRRHHRHTRSMGGYACRPNTATRRR
jgi:hypothetical protein